MPPCVGRLGETVDQQHHRALALLDHMQPNICKYHAVVGHDCSLLIRHLSLSIIPAEPIGAPTGNTICPRKGADSIEAPREHSLANAVCQPMASELQLCHRGVVLDLLCRDRFRKTKSSCGRRLSR